MIKQIRFFIFYYHGPERVNPVTSCTKFFHLDCFTESLNSQKKIDHKIEGEDLDSIPRELQITASNESFRYLRL